MYFYVLDGGSYEEYWKTVYYSETKYTQEEFKQILIEAYKYVCEEIVSKEKRFKICGFDFDVENVCWGWKKGEICNYGENDFNTYIKQHSNLIPIENEQIVTTISLGTCITPNENTKEFEESVDRTQFYTCHDNCFYDDDKWWMREKCVFDDIREEANRCAEEYMKNEPWG